MPGPYGSGVNYYKIDADSLTREEIIDTVITRDELNQRITDANNQMDIVNLSYNNQIAQAEAMLTILDTP